MEDDFYRAFLLIQQEWQKRSWQYLFYFTPVGRFLRQNHCNPFDFIQIYLKSSFYLDGWFPKFFALHSGYIIFPQVVEAAKYLKAEHLLIPEYFGAIISHKQPRDVAWGIAYLAKMACLTQDIVNQIALHPCPRDFAWGLSFLNQAGLLTAENQVWLFRFSTTHNLAWAMSYLHQAKILTQENFLILIAAENQFLLSYESLGLVWNVLPPQLLRRHWSQILAEARRPQPRMALAALVTQLLNPNGINAPVFNPRQSTHLRSVHRSVSTAAGRLKQRYGNNLVMEDRIADLQLFMRQFDEAEFKYQVAQRAIARLTHPAYVYIDAQSSVSILELLIYCFLAIQDPEKRVGSFADAKSAFIAALYEIQRGYNLDEAGEDDGLSDRPICASGTFNKLIEKLKGCHPDADFHYVSVELAQMKFPKLVAQYGFNYLMQVSRPKTARECQQVLALIYLLTQEGSIEVIWDSIRLRVEDELWSEFHEAYASDPQHPKFRALIEQGIYCASPNLGYVIAAVQQSKGFEDWCIQQSSQASRLEKKINSLVANSLWEQRVHDQHAFDRRFGLILRPKDHHGSFDRCCPIHP